MPIILTPETETLLRQKEERDGVDMNNIADSLLAEALHWEVADRAQTIEGIRRGLEDSDAGRVRPFTKFAAQMRTQSHLPVWNA